RKPSCKVNVTSGAGDPRVSRAPSAGGGGGDAIADLVWLVQASASKAGTTASSARCRWWQGRLCR
ncbi:MAG TPA: hypothetical protein VNO55_22160, partial [Polyangia bacterium]|nr:hypothetical protein [Polyangia bacterium]